MNCCKECGQHLPLDRWLRTQNRTLWTTAELVERYGWEDSAIGRELKRLGFKMKPMRVGQRGKRGYKVAVYMVRKSPAFASEASFLNAKPQDVRRALSHERFTESQAYKTLSTAAATVPAARDALARFAVTLDSDHM